MTTHAPLHLDTSQLSNVEADAYDKGYPCGYGNGSVDRKSGKPRPSPSRHPATGESIIDRVKSPEQCGVKTPTFVRHGAYNPSNPSRSYSVDITDKVLPHWLMYFERGYRDGYVDGWFAQAPSNPKGFDPSDVQDIGRFVPPHNRDPKFDDPTQMTAPQGSSIALAERDIVQLPEPAGATADELQDAGFQRRGESVDERDNGAGDDDKTLLVALGIVATLALGAAIFA